MRVASAVNAVVWVAVFAGMAMAGKKNVAVVNVEIDPSSGAVTELISADRRTVTDELRRRAVKNLPPKAYNVMTSETVIAQGGAALEECAEENCVITLGSKIGADFIVRGIISKLETKYTLTVEIYETEDGNLVASSEPVRAEKIGKLVEEVAGTCADMYKEFVALQNSTAQGPAQKPPVAVVDTVKRQSEPRPTSAAGHETTSITRSQYKFRSQPRIEYTLTTNVSQYNSGTVSRSLNQATYKPGTQVAVTAMPANGYTFAHWSGASTSTNRTVTLKMDSDKTLTAVFCVEFVDHRNNQTYKAVQIGNQIWMAENLNYKVSSGSWCYNNNESNCGKYGRLYEWETAKTVCPSGWHLPSYQEWNELVIAAGGYSAGKKLKSKVGWSWDRRSVITVRMITAFPPYPAASATPKAVSATTTATTPEAIGGRLPRPTVTTTPTTAALTTT